MDDVDLSLELALLRNLIPGLGKLSHWGEDIYWVSGRSIAIWRGSFAWGPDGKIWAGSVTLSDINHRSTGWLVEDTRNPPKPQFKLPPTSFEQLVAKLSNPAWREEMNLPPLETEDAA